MKLSDKMKREIIKQGYTAYRLSKETGISHQVISRFLNGERGINLQTADVIAEAIGLKLVK